MNELGLFDIMCDLLACECKCECVFEFVGFSIRLLLDNTLLRVTVLNVFRSH